MLIDLPSTRTEAWRWSDLSSLPDLIQRERSGIVPQALPWIDCGTTSPRLLFVDGQFDAVRSHPGPVTIGPPARTSDHALGRHAGQNGWQLHLEAGHAASGLIQIVHLTTGAGDHFNAGFVSGQLMGLSAVACLGLGVSTSGHYVRTARSPTLADLETFLANWK